jgi:ABC-type sugar transport system ATPase subunit
MMLGRALVNASVEKHAPANEKPALSVRDLSVPSGLRNVSFDLHYGEVLGLAGLIGSGRSQLMRALFGMIRPSDGEILLDGLPVNLRSSIEALHAGIFMLPEDRKVEGIFPHLNVLDNLLVKRPRPHDHPLARIFLAMSAERHQYQEIRDTLSVRAHSPFQRISTLSGGNQQKVLLGRSLVSKARVLLLNEPSRGVDVGTKVEIHELIRKIAQEHRAIIVSSSDVPELVKVSDRCLVLSAGRVAGLLEGSQVTEDNILALAVAQGTDAAVHGKVEVR